MYILCMLALQLAINVILMSKKYFLRRLYTICTVIQGPDFSPDRDRKIASPAVLIVSISHTHYLILIQIIL